MNAEIKKRIEMIKRGEVPEGYQKTKLGIVPEKWDINKIGAFTKEVSKKNVDNTINHVVSVTKHRGIVDSLDYFNNYQVYSKDLSLYKVITKNEYAFPPIHLNEGSIGKLSHRDKAVLSPMYTVFHLNSDKYNSDIFTYIVKSRKYVELYKSMVQGTVNRRGAISYSDFASIPILVPSLPEQKRIAALLSLYDRAIALLEKLSQEKNRQKNWLMQNLLTGKIRLPGYTGKWIQTTMGDNFTFEGSLSASRNELQADNGICYLHYGDIHKSTKSYIDVSKEFPQLPKLFTHLSNVNPNCLLTDGDVVFVDASEDYKGTCKYLVIRNKENIPFIAGLHTIIAHSKGAVINNEFKQHCFSTIKVAKQFATFANGISVYGISKNNLAKISFLLPPLAEQKAIAEVLSTADRELELHERHLEELKKQKKALMQLLLTGIVRVV